MRAISGKVLENDFEKDYEAWNAFHFDSVPFLREEKLGFTLPIAGDYATGIFFIDTDPNKVNVNFLIRQF